MGPRPFFPWSTRTSKIFFSLKPLKTCFEHFMSGFIWFCVLEKIVIFFDIMKVLGWVSLMSKIFCIFSDGPNLKNFFFSNPFKTRFEHFLGGFTWFCVLGKKNHMMSVLGWGLKILKIFLNDTIWGLQIHFLSVLRGFDFKFFWSTMGSERIVKLR